MGVKDDRHGEPDVFVTLDGQQFQVSRRPGFRPTYDYIWLNGSRQHYGFSTTLGDDQPWSFELGDHERQIRSFLSMIDPETGYIRETTTSDE